MDKGGPSPTSPASDPLPWECLICSTVFPTKRALKRHVDDTYVVLELWFQDGHMDSMKRCVLCQQENISKSFCLSGLIFGLEEFIAETICSQFSL
jgi:hypothetical protein